MAMVGRPVAIAALVLMLGLSGAGRAQEGPQKKIRAVLLAAPGWIVRWSPPDETNVYVAVVRFREEGEALMAASAHPDGSRCYPDILVSLQDNGFLFFGCTGVPKEMRFDAADPAAPFKGRAFGFSYRWTPAR